MLLVRRGCAGLGYSVVRPCRASVRVTVLPPVRFDHTPTVFEKLGLAGDTAAELISSPVFHHVLAGLDKTEVQGFFEQLSNKDLSEAAWQIVIQDKSEAGRSGLLIMDAELGLARLKARKMDISELVTLGWALTVADALNADLKTYMQRRILKEADIKSLTMSQIGKVVWILASNRHHYQPISQHLKAILEAIFSEFKERFLEVSAIQQYTMANQLASAGFMDDATAQRIDEQLFRYLNDYCNDASRLKSFFSEVRGAHHNVVGIGALERTLLANASRLDATCLSYLTRTLSFAGPISRQVLDVLWSVLSQRKLVILSSAYTADLHGENSDLGDPGDEAPSADDKTGDGSPSVDGKPAASSPSPAGKGAMQWSGETASLFLASIALSEHHSATVIGKQFLDSEGMSEYMLSSPSACCRIADVAFGMTNYREMQSLKIKLVRNLSATKSDHLHADDVLRLLRVSINLHNQRHPLALEIFSILDRSDFEQTVPLKRCFNLAHYLTQLSYPLTGVVDIIVRSLNKSTISWDIVVPVIRCLAMVGLGKEPRHQLAPILERMKGLSSEEVSSLCADALTELVWGCVCLGWHIPASLVLRVLADDTVKSLDVLGLQKVQQINGVSKYLYSASLSDDSLQYTTAKLRSLTKSSPYHTPRVVVAVLADLRQLQRCIPPRGLQAGVVTTAGQFVPGALLLNASGKAVNWLPALGDRHALDAHQLKKDKDLQAVAVMPLPEKFYQASLKSKGDRYVMQERRVTLRGATRMQVRALELAGWKVIAFPWQQWHTNSNKLSFLEDLLVKNGVARERSQWEVRHKAEAARLRERAPQPKKTTEPFTFGQ